MDENNVNGYGEVDDDDEGTTVLVSRGVVSTDSGNQMPQENSNDGQYAQMNAQQMPYGDQMNSQYGQQTPYGDQMNGQYGQQMPHGDQMNGQYGQQTPYGDQMNGQYGQQTPYGDQMNGQYGQQMPYGDQMNGQYGQQMPYGDQMNGQYGQQMPYGGQMNGQYGQQMPYGGQMNGQYGQPSGMQPGKPINKKLLLIIGGAAAAIVLVLVLVLALGGGGAGSPEKLAENFVKAYEGGKADDVYKLYNSKMVKLAMKEDDLTEKEIKEDLQDEIDVYCNRDDLERAVGEIESIKITDIDDETYEKGDSYLADYIEYVLGDEYTKGLNVTGLTMIEGELNVKGEDDDVDCDFECYGIKIGSKWYLIEFDVDFDYFYDYVN